VTAERAVFPGLRKVSPDGPKVVALLIAEAGVAELEVRGEPLLAHAVRGLFASGCVDRMIVVAPSEADSITRAVPGVERRVPPVSATRADSVRLAFEAAGPCDVVLVHDAARAFVPPATIRAVAEAVCQGAEAAVPVLPVTDTVKLVDAAGVIVATEDRSRLRTLQAPFGCTGHVLRDACARGIDPLSNPPGKVCAVDGHPNAIRLTTPFEVAVAEALLLDEEDSR